MWLSRKFEALFASAGITVNGNHPGDISVRDSRLYREVLLHGSLGLGEAYMRGWWDCERLDVFFCKILRSGLEHSWPNLGFLWHTFRNRFGESASKVQTFHLGEVHYSLGNDLFAAMLDPRMVYSCGYWKEADNLDRAQENKLRLTCDRLKLEPGMTLLDVGCGFGSLLKYAAEHYGVRGVGITVSEEQAKLARELCADLPVEIRLQDYRELKGSFDRVVSVGMFEHVGPKSYGLFMQAVKRCLARDGCFLLHTIGKPRPGPTDPWIKKYIFPSGWIPTASEIRRAMDGLFEEHLWDSFGGYYDPTLMAWYQNFTKAWPKLEGHYEQLMGGTFRRLWEYYLLSCAGAFRVGEMDVCLAGGDDPRLACSLERPRFFGCSALFLRQFEKWCIVYN